MTLSDALREVIPLAEVVDAYWDAELPKQHPDYPILWPGEPETPPPPQEATLRDLLASLPEDDLYQLLLIMDLGGGRFGTEDLAGRLRGLRDRFESPNLVISALLEAPLADDLKYGLEELEEKAIDLDHLTPIPAHSGR